MDPRTEKMLAERRQPAAASGPLGVRLPAFLNPLEKWLRAHWALASIGSVVLVAAIVGGHHLFVTRPALEREREALEQARAREQMALEFDVKQASLETCLSATETDRTSTWEAACRARHWKSGCSLPRDIVEQHQRAYTDRRNDCLRRFSLNSAEQ